MHLPGPNAQRRPVAAGDLNPGFRTQPPLAEWRPLFYASSGAAERGHADHRSARHGLVGNFP